VGFVVKPSRSGAVATRGFISSSMVAMRASPGSAIFPHRWPSCVEMDVATRLGRRGAAAWRGFVPRGS
jgi:hypothetical protein